MNEAVKIISIILFGLALGIFLSELVLRIIGIHPMFVDFSTNPPNALEMYPNIGWRFKEGCYVMTKNMQTNKPIPNSNFCIDKNLNRSIPLKYNSNSKKIHLYGCSFTFGQSVSDTSNMAYYLQELLPNYQIVNKGVSGYNLLQMYISLQADVKRNFKPDIAIFNYVSFHHERHPIHNTWIKGLSDQIKYSVEWKKEKTRISYPYVDIDKDSNIVYRTLKWEDMPTNSSLRYKSSLINLIESLFDKINENKIKHHLQFLDYKLALEIINFCALNNIKLVFAGFDKECVPFLQNIEAHHNANTLYYDIDISLPENNCAPLDPGHPSSKVHKKCAEVLSNYTKKNNRKTKYN